MSFIRKHKNYVLTSAMTCLSCAVIFILIYILVLGPQIRKARWLESQYKNVAEEYESASLISHQDSMDNLNKYINDMQEIMRCFSVESGDLADLTFDLSRIASDQQLSVFNIISQNKSGNSKENKAEHISENLIEISFDAGYMEFAQFVYALETHKPVLFVREFEINRSNEESFYTVQMNLAALVQKDNDNSKRPLLEIGDGVEKEKIFFSGDKSGYARK